MKPSNSRYYACSPFTHECCREFDGFMQYESEHHPFWQWLDRNIPMVYYIICIASYRRNNSLGLYSLSRGGKRIVFMLEYTPFMNLRLSEYTSTVSHLPLHPTTSKSWHSHYFFKKFSPLWSPSYSLIESSGSHHCNYINFHREKGPYGVRTGP